MAEGGGCCNDSQVAFLVLFAVYMVLVWYTWQMPITKPLRLVAVFLHEFSHAVACWLTCGEVDGIEVHNNEGGVTRYRGGCRVLIIPAGYLGCSFLGACFTVLSGGRWTSLGAALSLVAALLISLCYSPNRAMVFLNLAFAAFTLAFVAVEWYVFSPVLTYLVLLYGVFIGTYSIYDIYADLCRRTVAGSDAHACHQECPCCLPRCVGAQWALCALVMQLLAVWTALVLMGDECRDQSWGGCLSEHGPFALFAFDRWDLDRWDLDTGQWTGGGP